jgi:4-oxalocrotonate tautomerase
MRGHCSETVAAATSETQENNMPLVDIQLIEGVFSADEKRRMIENVTEAMVQIEGEAVRGVTWVRIQEFASGAWGIAGKGLTTEDVKTLRGTQRAPERRSA